jgi:hypothetical protein
MEELTQEQINKLWELPLLRVADASRLLGVSRQQIGEMLSKYKRIPVEKIDGKIYVKSEDLLKYAMAHKRSLLERVNKIKLPDNF